MERVDIIVSTRGRLSKLHRMLKSIPEQAGKVQVLPFVVCDADQQTLLSMLSLKQAGRRLGVLHVPEQSGSVHCRNMALELTKDAIIYATDDMVFRPWSIRNAIEAMAKHFPDEDGVIGFVQEGNAFHPGGVCLVGAAYLARFERRHLFFPGYFHFAAQEVHRGAAGCGRFFQAPNAVIYHFHPVNHRKEMDKTHLEARARKPQDMALDAERRRLGLIWGRLK